MTTYLRHGCVPVVVQDGVDMPFERVGAFRGSVDGGGGGDGGRGGGAPSVGFVFHSRRGGRRGPFGLHPPRGVGDGDSEVTRRRRGGVEDVLVRRSGAAGVWAGEFIFIFIFICMWAIGLTYVVFFYSRGGRLECSAAGSEVAALVTSPRVVTVTGSGGSRVRRVTRSR